MDALSNQTLSSSLVTHEGLLHVVQTLELVEQHCAKIDSDLSKGNKRSDRDDDHLVIQEHLMKPKEGLRRKNSHPKEVSHSTNQQFVDSEVQQHTQSDPTASLSTVQRDERTNI